MYSISEPSTARVVKLTSGTFSSATTQVKLLRVDNAVNINNAGQLVFQFAYSEVEERAFYDNFFLSVSLYDENAAKSQANYFVTTLANNPNAFTIEEVAFLAKTMVTPNWTYPVLMTWEQWENLCRTNTVAFATLFSQLTAGNPPTGNSTGDSGNTNTNNGSPTLPPIVIGGKTTDATDKGTGITSWFSNPLVWLGGVIAFLLFINRNNEQ